MNPLRSFARAVRNRLLRQRRPLAETIDLTSPAIARDPYPHYELLRAGGSVHHLAHHDAWLILGHADVQSAFAQPDIFSNDPYAPLDPVLLGSDPPQHDAMRRIVMRVFDAGTLTRAADAARIVAFDALAREELDVIRHYAMPVSEAAAAQLLGLDAAAAARMRSAHDARSPEELMTRLADAAEDAPLYARLHESGMNDADASSIVRLLWLAGSKTTERVIGRCVLRLLQHPAVRDAVTRDRTLVPTFVDEVIRLDPPEHTLRRRTTRAVTLGNITIPPNAHVLLSLGAANRDPAAFDDPSTIRLGRTTRHFGFGSGVHYCIGAVIGRRIVELAISALLDRAPAFSAAQPLDDLVTWSSITENPIAALRIALRKDFA